MLDVFWKKLEEVVQMFLFFKEQYFSGSQQLGAREGGRSREIGEGKKSISMREKEIEKKRCWGHGPDKHEFLCRHLSHFWKLYWFKQFSHKLLIGSKFKRKIKEERK